MSESPEHLLSIVIVNRNTAGLLMDCLEHVFESDLPRTPQVIVVDNGSTDSSVEQVRKSYPQVLVIEAGRNLGFAAASNRAIEKSDGDILVIAAPKLDFSEPEIVAVQNFIQAGGAVLALHQWTP